MLNKAFAQQEAKTVHHRQGKATKAPKPEIAVTVPLLFAPSQRQKGKAAGVQCAPS